MNKFQGILLLFFSLSIVIFGCKKETDTTPENNLPEGATPFTAAELEFVPFTGSSPVYKTIPDFNSELILTFKERITEEDYYAWDQTYFTYSTDTDLELELRFRYLQADISQKTLAMYFPYRDNGGMVRENLFEIPLSSSEIEAGFFQNTIDYHDTLVINSTEFYKVYEVQELVSTDPEKDGPTNLAKVYYNKTYGIIMMKQRDGISWMLQF